MLYCVLRDSQTGRAGMQEDPKQIVREFWEVAFNQGNLERLDQLVSPDFVVHDLALHQDYGVDDLKRLIEANLRQKLSLRAEIQENLSAEGEHVVTRFVLRRAEPGNEVGQTAAQATGSEHAASSDAPAARHASSVESQSG